MDRRALLALGAVALFAAGFGLGWLVRGEHEAPADLEAAVEAAATPDGAVASADEAADGGVIGSEGEAVATARGATHEGGDAPPAGEGDVAVIGGEGSGASSGGEGGGDEAGGSEAERVAASTDGGVPGTLNRESIQGVVNEHRDELGFCFAWQLHSHPELGGRITMEFVIGPDGRVTDSRVIDDELGDEVVQRCFVGVTRRMEFPPPDGGGDVTVRYPFILRADDEAQE